MVCFFLETSWSSSSSSGTSVAFAGRLCRMTASTVFSPSHHRVTFFPCRIFDHTSNKSSAFLIVLYLIFTIRCCSQEFSCMHTTASQIIHSSRLVDSGTENLKYSRTYSSHAVHIKYGQEGQSMTEQFLNIIHIIYP